MQMNGAPPLTVSPPARGPLAALARALRLHWVVVLLCTLLTAAAGVAAVSLAASEYSATAKLLLTPIPKTDRTFYGLDLFRDSADPARTAPTVAALLESPTAAELAADELGPPWTPERVLGAVTIEVQGATDVLHVTGTADDPETAGRLTNVFARAAIATRVGTLRSQLGARIRRFEARRRQLEPGEERNELERRIADLEAVRAEGRDPSVALAQPAPLRGSRKGIPILVAGAVCALVGLLIGIAAALAIEYFNRRIRDPDELVRLYPLPVLARVPEVPHRETRRGPIPPLAMPPGAREAFRTLQAQLEQRGGTSRVVMVSSASAGDGKTTAAAGLGAALVDATYSVILLDFDLRKPELARHLGIAEPQGFGPLLTGSKELFGLLVEAPEVPGMTVLPAAVGDAVFLESVIRRMPALLAEARGMADYVVLDTPPLGEVSDALRIVRAIDDLVLVARPGHTNRYAFEQARDLLERSNARPAGLLLTGQSVSGSGAYDTYGAPVGVQAR